MQVPNAAAHKTLPEFEGIEEELVNEEFTIKERKASAQGIPRSNVKRFKNKTAINQRHVHLNSI